MKPDTNPDALRITQQFRSGQAMVYDLRCAAGRLTLRVTGRGGDEDQPPSAWRIEAATSSSPEAVVAAAWAVTRAEALQAVGQTWSEKRVACNLPAFDWESVACALRAVRAI